MEAVLTSNRRTSRLAALLFFTVCVTASTWGLSYVPSKIFVPKDAAATARNLLSNEFLFRTGILSHFVSTIAFAIMILMFYRIFRPVDKLLSRIMITSVLVQVPVVFVLELFKITALMILNGGVLSTLEITQKHEASYLLLRMHGYGIVTSQFFWGLCFIPFGMLVYRSGFIPRIFGVLLMITGIGYVADMCTFVLLERHDYLLLKPFIIYSFMGGGLTMLWFLIKGVRNPSAIVSDKKTSIIV